MPFTIEDAVTQATIARKPIGRRDIENDTPAYQAHWQAIGALTVILDGLRIDRDTKGRCQHCPHCTSEPSALMVYLAELNEAWRQYKADRNSAAFRQLYELFQRVDP